MTDWRLEVDLKNLNDWLTTCHNMTGGGGVMTTSASIGVIYSAPRPLAGFEGMGWEGQRRREGKEDERR